MTGAHTDSAQEPGDDGWGERSFAEEASHLWALAADRSSWGFIEEASELRRLAIAKRVQAMLTQSAARQE